MKTTEKTFTGVPATFPALVAMHRPGPIHDEASFDAATDVVMKMAGHALNKDQEDYLDLLSTLIEVYDQEHHAIAAATMTPIEALKYLLEENGMNVSDFGRLIGNRSLGSKILRGERDLSKSHILTLAKRFSVRPDLFLGRIDFPTPVAVSAGQLPKVRKPKKLVSRLRGQAKQHA
jgi:HTH-type transcriptional regulator/antitoxin HigA